jgi:hypothetical protein
MFVAGELCFQCRKIVGNSVCCAPCARQTAVQAQAPGGLRVQELRVRVAGQAEERQGVWAYGRAGVWAQRPSGGGVSNDA